MSVSMPVWCMSDLASTCMSACLSFCLTWVSMSVSMPVFLSDLTSVYRSVSIARLSVWSSLSNAACMSCHHARLSVWSSLSLHFCHHVCLSAWSSLSLHFCHHVCLSVTLTVWPFFLSLSMSCSKNIFTCLTANIFEFLSLICLSAWLPVNEIFI